MKRDPTFGLELEPHLMVALMALPEREWLDFLDRLEVRESLRIRECTTDEERHKTQVRTLFIGELRTFFKSLYAIDKA